jgi:hypothetical protein
VVLRAPTKTEHLEILDVEYVRFPMEPFREPPGAELARRHSAELSADPSIVNRTIRLNGVDYTVVGVVRRTHFRAS